MLRVMSASQGPTFRELAVQALSSVQHGYDLLAPKFDHTGYRTPASVLDSVTGALRGLGPFGSGLDVCCGTGAGMGVLRQVCRERITGVDFSAGMLAEGRARTPVAPDAPRTDWVRADVRALPFGPVFDLAVSFGAFGHFLPRELPGLFAQVHSVLRPGGTFAFPIGAPARPGSRHYWELLAFDTAMRVAQRAVAAALCDVLPDLPARGGAGRAAPGRVRGRTASTGGARPASGRQPSLPTGGGHHPAGLSGTILATDRCERDPRGGGVAAPGAATAAPSRVADDWATSGAI